MADEFHIRAARREDADAAVALWRQMADQHAEHDAECWRWADDADDHWRTFFLEFPDREDRIALVAVDSKDRPVGFVMAMVSEAPPVHAARRRGAITDMAVSPACRRRGLGRRLLAAAFEALEAAGAESVRLSVAVANSAALELYRKLGMRIVNHSMYKRL